MTPSTCLYSEYVAGAQFLLQHLPCPWLFLRRRLLHHLWGCSLVRWGYIFCIFYCLAVEWIEYYVSTFHGKENRNWKMEKASDVSGSKGCQRKEANDCALVACYYMAWSRQLELVEVEKDMFYTGRVGGDHQILKNNLQFGGEAEDIANT